MNKKNTDLGLIPEHWNVVEFEDVAELKHGYQFRTPDFTETGVKVFKITQIKSNGVIDISNCDFIARERVEDFERVVINKGDILMALTGATIGKVARYDDEDIILQNYRVGNFIPRDSEALSKDYFYYFLSSNLFFHQVLARQTQSAQQNIGKEEINRMQVILPPIEEQELIASALKSLDHKINLNRQTNQTLEHIAQAIFKSWFVDFEPTRAKIAAKQTDQDPERAAMAAISGKSLEELDHLSPEQQEQLLTTAALFPDSLVDSELGEIPEGWNLKTISDFGKVVTGKTPPKKIEDAYDDIGAPFITPTDIDDSVFVTSTNRSLTEEGQQAVRKSEIEAGTICVTCIGSQMGKATVSPQRAYTNQQINSIVVSENYLRNYLLLNLRNRREEIFLIGSSGSTMPIINKSTFEKLDVLFPNSDLLNQFDSLIEPQLKKIMDGALENICLADIRNSLLPKLLSGEPVNSEFVGGL
jgi:type I restriction enzyme S subunit